VNNNAGGRATLTRPGTTPDKTSQRTFSGRIGALRWKASPIDIVIALVIIAIFYVRGRRETTHRFLFLMPALWYERGGGV
jgi:hypothetical protein